MRSRLCAIGVLLILSLAARGEAQVWIMTQITTDGGGIGDGIGSTPNYTQLTQWSTGADPQKLNEVTVAGYHLDGAIVKEDRSEVIGRYRDDAQKMKWIVYNFERMKKEQRVTNLNPEAGYEVVDVQYVDGRVTMLSRKGESDFNCYQMPDDGGKWKRIFATDSGDLSGLDAFPYAKYGNDAMQIVAKLPYARMGNSSTEQDAKWWAFFGGHGSSEAGAFDYKTGVVAVTANIDGDSLTIARASGQQTLTPIRVDKILTIQQIAIIDGFTYIARGDNTIGVYDAEGKSVGSIHGNQIASS